MRYCYAPGCDNELPDYQGSDYCGGCLVDDQDDPHYEELVASWINGNRTYVIAQLNSRLHLIEFVRRLCLHHYREEGMESPMFDEMRMIAKLLESEGS